LAANQGLRHYGIRAAKSMEIREIREMEIREM
jgi:hypothetical protein